jgi:hypothetical protein
MAQKITAALVKATKPTPRDFVIWDTVLQRFGLRVKPSGAKSFIIQYQHNGKSHRMKIGTHPAMKP